VGVLLVDAEAGEVRFEGNRERARIPAAAVEACEVEQTLIGGSLEHYFTVVRVRHPGGVREYPFAFRGDMGHFAAEVRRQRAAALRDHILGLTRRRE
jgi:hypothetical protein